MTVVSKELLDGMRLAIQKRKFTWESHFSNGSIVTHLSDPLGDTSYCGALLDSPYRDSDDHLASLNDIGSGLANLPGSPRYCRRCYVAAQRRVERILQEEISKLEKETDPALATG